MEIMREPDESLSDAWGIPSPAVAHCDARIEGGTRTGCVAGRGWGWAFEHLDEPLPVFFCGWKRKSGFEPNFWVTHSFQSFEKACQTPNSRPSNRESWCFSSETTFGSTSIPGPRGDEQEVVGPDLWICGPLGPSTDGFPTGLFETKHRWDAWKSWYLGFVKYGMWIWNAIVVRKMMILRMGVTRFRVKRIYCSDLLRSPESFDIPKWISFWNSSSETIRSCSSHLTYKSRGEISGDFPLQVRDVDFLKPYLKTALPLLQVAVILA